MSGSGDQSDLARFGYRQELARSLGSFSAFAAGFSYISILTGMFQMFYLGYQAGGPGFFWSWPLVLAGQLLVALCFAELSAHYPLAGGVYQWSLRTGSAVLGWMTGWIYLGCLVATLAAVSLALQNSLPQIWSGFQLLGSTNNAADVAQNAVLFACLLILFSTLVNTIGVRLLSAINNTGVFCELLGIAVLIFLLAWHVKRGAAAAVVPSLGSKGLSGYAGSFLAATALTVSYVLYGFDTAGSLAEETTNPRERAPRAILHALLAAGISGSLLLLLSLMAARSLTSPELTTATGGLGFVVRDVLGEGLGRLLLCDVIVAIVACAMAVHSGTVRLIFSMARDGKLPFSRRLAFVSPRSHLPVLPTLVAATLAIGLLVANLRFPKVVELVTSVAALWANLAYLLVMSCLLYRRWKGWPGKPVEPVFSLGRLGLPINALATAWSSFMVVNLGWPRAEVYGGEWYFRFSPCLLTFTLVFVGATYYYLFQRPRPEGLGLPEFAVDT